MARMTATLSFHRHLFDRQKGIRQDWLVLGFERLSKEKIKEENVMKDDFRGLSTTKIVPIINCRLMSSLNDAIRFPHLDISTVESL